MTVRYVFNFDTQKFDAVQPTEIGQIALGGSPFRLLSIDASGNLSDDEAIAVDVVSTWIAPATPAWFHLFSTNAVQSTGGFSMMQITMLREGATAADQANGLFITAEGNNSWCAHLNIDDLCDGGFGFVVGNHGTNSIAGVFYVDNSTTNTGVQISSGVSGAFNLLEFRSDRHPVLGNTATTFTGKFISFQNQSTEIGYINYRGSVSFGQASSQLSTVLGILDALSVNYAGFSSTNDSFIYAESRGLSALATGSLFAGFLNAGSAPTTGQPLVSFAGGGFSDNGLSTAAIISVTADGNWSSTSTPTRIGIYTTLDATKDLLVERIMIYNNGNIVINETGADADFRIESDGNPNMFCIDASTNRVGIGTNAPGSTFQVVGTLSCSTINTGQGDYELTATTYTPTRSAESNLDSNVTMSEAQYIRVGNVVTVSGRFTADPTLATTATSFEFTLPIASNIGAAEDCAGIAFCGSIAGMGAEITGSVANNTAVVSWVASDITSQTWSYTFTYQII